MLKLLIVATSLLSAMGVLAASNLYFGPISKQRLAAMPCSQTLKRYSMGNPAKNGWFQYTDRRQMEMPLPPPPKSTVKNPLLKATLWTIGTLLSFMAMAIGCREVSDTLATFQILFARSLVGLTVISIVLSIKGWNHIRTRKRGLHLLRNIIHFGGQYGWFYGIACIPLANVFAIEFTVPLWTLILAAFLLKERITRTRILAIILGLAGMLVILRPGLITIEPAALAVLAGAICYALSHTLSRKLAQIDSPLAIVFYMALIQLPLGFIPAMSQWVWPDLTGWFWLTIVAVCALTSHYCMSKALSLADAAIVVTLDFLRLPLIALFGYILYRESLNQWVFIGATIMLTGNVINLKAEQSRFRGKS